MDIDKVKCALETLKDILEPMDFEQVKRTVGSAIIDYRQNEGEKNRKKGKRRDHPDRHEFTTVVLVPGRIANFVITTTIARWPSQLTAMHVPEPIHDGHVY